jgi:hypothetical protein
MSDANNDLLAKAALALGFCTPAQIAQCLRIQSATTEGLSLGQSLLREGFISGEQYSQILKALRSGFRSGDSVPIRGVIPGEPAAPVDHQPAVDSGSGRTLGKPRASLNRGLSRRRKRSR